MLTEDKAEDTSLAENTLKEASGEGHKTEEAEETKVTEETTAAEVEAAKDTEAVNEAEAGGTAEAKEEEIANESEAKKDEGAGVARNKRIITRQEDPPVSESPEAPESKRARKTADSFVPDNFNKTKVTIIKGRGSRLGDIPNVRESIVSNNSDDIFIAHRLLFPQKGNPRKDGMKLKKSQILDFSGYLTPLIEGEDEKERADIDEKAEVSLSIPLFHFTR